MHPDIAQNLVGQRYAELQREAAESRRRPAGRFPRWHISWSRTILSPAGTRRGSSLVIVISAHRSA
jgi:hypothetical protein